MTHKTRPKRPLTVLLATVAAIALILAAGYFLRSAGRLSIADSYPPHTVNVSGESFTAWAPWGHSGAVCSFGGDIVTTDASGPAGLGVAARFPNTGNQQCATYDAAIRVRLDRGARGSPRRTSHTADFPCSESARRPPGPQARSRRS